MRRANLQTIVAFISLSCGLLLIGCQPEEVTLAPALMEVPAGFPEVPQPADNHFTLERWQLGKRLFYDKALSLQQNISCASCHHQALAFSDSVALSIGDGQTVGRSNAPTLANVAYLPYYTRAGGVPTLEMQVLVPVQEHDEFNFNIVEIAARLGADSSYQRQARAAYQRDFDPYVITRALANFERSLLSGNSPYDKALQQGAHPQYGSMEQQGAQIFHEVGCDACHGGFNFTDNTFQNNGLYEEYADLGRMRLTGVETDRALFKVPTLRNIALTAPYMHDGSIPTLAAVIEHYNSGGKSHPHKSALVRPLHLHDDEKIALLRFLASLTDDAFVNNPNFRP